MRTSIAAGLVCAALLNGSCAGGQGDGVAVAPTTTADRSVATAASPTFGRGRVIIDTGEDSVLLDVEVADTPEARQLGLMHRTSLASDTGMVFMFFEPASGGFWMKDTLIPLSIAFFDQDGLIVKVLDMDPCTKDPCPIYEPGVAYVGALEVNQGAFERWGVTEGDRIQVNQ